MQVQLTPKNFIAAAPAAPAKRVEASWLTELLSNPRVFAARVRAALAASR